MLGRLVGIRTKMFASGNDATSAKTSCCQSLNYHCCSIYLELISLRARCSCETLKRWVPEHD